MNTHGKTHMNMHGYHIHGKPVYEYEWIPYTGNPYEYTGFMKKKGVKPNVKTGAGAFGKYDS